MKLKLGLLCLVFLTIALLVTPLTALSSAVRPLVIQLNASPGDRQEFEFVIASEDSQEMADISIYQITQKSNGSCEFHKGGTNPMADWIILDQNRVIIPPMGETTVTGRVNVPFNAGGTYTAAIMVEPQSTHVTQGVTVRYRYAITLIVNVQRPGLRPDLSIHSLGLEADEKMAPVVKAVIQNTSSLLFPMTAEITIRDKNRALIERLELLTPAAKETPYGNISIYPGVELWLEGLITKPLFPGEYELRLFLRYADGKQKIHTQVVTVSEGDFGCDIDETVKYLEVKPDILQAELRPGGAGSQILELTNHSNEPLLIEIGGQDIEPDFSRSIFHALQMELRSGNVLEIAPRRTARVIMTLRVPRDGAAGGYYGYINVAAFSQDLQFLQAYEIPIYALVGQDWYYETEILSTLASTIGEEQIISVTLKNGSNVHIAPSGTCYLKNLEGEILRSIPLSLPEGVRNILPGYTGYLIAEGLTIPTGNYEAEIVIALNGNQIASTIESISIQDSN